METVEKKKKLIRVEKKMSGVKQPGKHFFVGKNGRKMMVETDTNETIMKRRNPAYTFLM